MCQTCRDQSSAQLSPAARRPAYQSFFGTPPQGPPEASSHENETGTEAEMQETLANDDDNRQSEEDSLSDSEGSDSGSLSVFSSSESLTDATSVDDAEELDLSDLYFTDDEEAPEQIRLAEEPNLHELVKREIKAILADRDLVKQENIRLQAALRQQAAVGDQQQARDCFPAPIANSEVPNAPPVSDGFSDSQINAAFGNTSAPQSTANSASSQGPLAAAPRVSPEVKSSHARSTQSATASQGTQASLSPRSAPTVRRPRQPQRGAIVNLNVRGEAGDTFYLNIDMTSSPTVEEEVEVEKVEEEEVEKWELYEA